MSTRSRTNRPVIVALPALFAFCQMAPAQEPRLFPACRGRASHPVNRICGSGFQTPGHRRQLDEGRVPIQPNDPKAILLSELSPINPPKRESMVQIQDAQTVLADNLENDTYVGHPAGWAAK